VNILSAQKGGPANQTVRGLGEGHFMATSNENLVISYTGILFHLRVFRCRFGAWRLQRA